MSHPKEILEAEEVEFLLSPGSNPQAAGTQTETEPQVVTMRGDLQQIQLADIFQTLGTAKMEGTLVVSNPIEQRQVFFKDGQVRILVAQRTTTRRLGQRLVAAGILDSEDLRKALIEQRKVQQPLGQLLVAKGYVTAEQLEEILAEQINEELFGLFTWDHGTFEFYRGPCTEPATLQRLTQCPMFEINSLLLEVARRADEWQDILAAVGSVDEVPIRVDVDESQLGGLGESHRAVLLAVDGKTSFRALADQAMLSLFECARAARDLVKQGLVQCATPEQMLAAARSHLESGDTKGALMMAHVLRNRGAELPVPIVRDLASLLRACNEHTLACTTVLEAAQLQSDAKVALELAREAHGYNPRDLGALSFLRTTLLAYLPPESPEIEATTLSLLDGLLADGDADRVLAIADEVGQIGHRTPAVLVRQARALAKKKEIPAAVDTLVQAAEAYGAAGERPRQIEAYELALRLDRERKDVRKLVRQLRMTPKKRLVRALTIGATALLLLGMGGVWLSVLRHGRQLVAACTDIKNLLAKADYAAATTALARWQERLGEGPEVQDLEQQVKFAVASAQAQQRTAARKRAAERLRQAAASLQAGDLTAACAIYDELLADELVRPDAETAVEVQFTELAHGLEEAGRQLAGSLPETPNELSDQRQIEDTLAIVRKKANPLLLQAALALQQMHGQNRLPAILTQARQQALVAAAQKALPVLRRAADLQSACERLSTRHDEQRRLDPLFRAALDHEQAFAFREALQDYEQLLAARAGNDDLLAHFRTKIADLQAIVRSLEALQRAAADGDSTAARQHLGALKRLAPTVPFETFVKLPITVRTSLPGAGVQWNGTAAGRTPCVTSFVPKGRNDIVVTLAGFRVERPTLPADPTAPIDVLLTLQAEGQGDLRATVDQTLAAVNGTVFGVDRAGDVFAIDLANRRELWRQTTGDTAGYLSPPLLAAQEVVVASLDGPVRAFDRASGAPRWRHNGLPTEYSPARVGDQVAVATTGGALVLLDGGNEFVRTSLPSPPAGDVLASGNRLALPLQNGSVDVRDARTLELVWREALGQNLVVGAGMLAALQDNGRVSVRELATGNELWHKDLTGSAVGRLCTDGSSLLVTLDDHVVEFALRDGREVWTTARPECGWLDAARFVGRQIVVPTRDGSVLVYGNDRPEPRYRLDGDRKSVVLQGDAGGAVAFTGRRFAIYRALP